jgi:hypothetical protein
MIPKQVGWCVKCGASFATLRAFKKHLKEEERKEEQICNDLAEAHVLEQEALEYNNE